MTSKHTVGFAHLLLIIGVVLAGIFLVGFSYIRSNRLFLGNGQVPSWEMKKIDEKLEPILNTPTITNNLKTYKNTECSFSVMIPEDWKSDVTDHFMGDEGSKQVVIYKDSTTRNTIFIICNSTQSWNKIVEQGADEYRTNGNFNGYPAWVSIRGIEDARANDSVIIKSPVSNHYVTIIFDSPSGNKNKEVDQTLSTFQFLEHNSLEDLETICEQNNGSWLVDFQECETTSSYEGIGKTLCLELGGSFTECASLCRNNPEAETCPTICTKVCKF